MIDAQPRSGEAPLRVRLDAASSRDADGIIVAYQWDFGDGITTRGTAAEHTFAAPGTYLVELILRDNDGAEARVAVEILVEPPNVPPTASFTVTPAAAVPGESVRFDASASMDSDGVITSFEWDLGDGSTTASGMQVDHAFAEAGTYTVTLTAADDDGATVRATRVVLAGGTEQPAVATFTPSSAAIEVGGTVQFDASASHSPAGDVVDYAWSFSDGGTASGKIVGHRFESTGTHIVNLTVTDETGASAMATGSVHVGVDPPADGDAITRSYWWSYGGRDRSLQASIPGDLYAWARAQSRASWPRRDYDEYVLNTLDDALMIEIAGKLALGSYRATAENALAFVQMSIAYQSDPDLFEYPRYPVETLVDEGGDCEDTAILYASLIRTLGHGALLVAVDTSGDGNTDHMVVFVPIDDTFETCEMDCVWEYNGRLYALAETAVEGSYLPLGQDPWGLEPNDIHQTWDVSRVDTSPKVIKRLPLAEPED